MPRKQKPPSPRKIRHSEFEQSLAATPASHDILMAAFQQLAFALQERPHGIGTKDNHYSRFSAGAIVLLVTALDAWLSEIVAMAVSVQARPPSFKRVTQETLWAKYKGLCRLAKIPALPAKKDLLFIVSLRNEVAHFLPRDAQRSRYYRALKRRGLLLPGTFLGDYGLNNYATAYWVAETTESITAQLGSSLVLTSGSLADWADNFRIPAEIVPPQGLATSQWKRVGHIYGAPPKDELKRLGRNDPCWCDSGKKYKDCHEDWMVSS
jgi:SEC-C motif